MAIAPSDVCCVCLEQLQCWPGSGDFATAELELAQLECGHAFHSQCLLATEAVVWRLNGAWAAKSQLLLAQSCPACRAPWHQDQITLFVLGDIDEAEEADSQHTECQETGWADQDADRAETSEGPREGRDERTDAEAAPEQRAAWTRYRDPESLECFWTNAERWFWEHGDDWRVYMNDGRRWWSCELDDSLWFYEDTGAQH